MKTLIFLVLLLFVVYSNSFSQSLWNFQSGTGIVVEAGADICADSVIINGTFSGTGTICGYQDVEPIPPFLSTPANNNLNVVPVVIIRYLPSTDGINLDPSTTGITSTLAAMKSKIDIMDKQIKFSLEEGSKFHGYSNSNARPTLGYKVVYYVTVYENIPRSNFQVPWNPSAYRPDYDAILNRFNAQYFVEQLGVREFWIWGYHHGDIEPVESNMSSALTGDISNSERRNDDLPIYNKTYVLYNYNYERSQAEAVHNHGHQLEAVLSYINDRQSNNTILFWDKFVGKESNIHITGRCGWTHMPPNTTDHYDYINYTTVQSDIEDWTPDRTGQLKYVNASTWGSINYIWPSNVIPSQQIESNWYIYWFQNMPGFGNMINYSGSYYMTNWWKFTANWDTCIVTNTGLFGQPKSLQLTALVQGFYDPVTNKMIKDTVTVYLRNSSSPFAIIDSSKNKTDSTGKTTLIFWNALSGSSKYIIIKHRNSIETWSATGQSISDSVTNYNFSTALSQAYGNNMIQVDNSPVRFAVFSGDVNQDGFVNLTDITKVYNDATNFVTGYVTSDINGDGIVNLTDLLKTFNNSSGFVSISRP